MADVPASIGYMRVTGQMMLGYADSDDAGEEPDARPAIATVTFTSTAPTPIVAVEEQILFAIIGPKCELDADGFLVAPADGDDVDNDGDQSTPGVSLIAPNQASLSNVGWQWTATFKPISPQKWSGFTIKFSGEPGDVLNLADLSLIASTSALTQQPVVWVQSGISIPAGARAGQFIYDTDTDDLYLIGA